jgi:hypothetical protein
MTMEQLEMPHRLPTSQVIRATMTTLTPLQIASVKLQRDKVRIHTHRYCDHSRQIYDVFLSATPSDAALPLTTVSVLSTMRVSPPVERSSP